MKAASNSTEHQISEKLKFIEKILLLSSQSYIDSLISVRSLPS